MTNERFVTVKTSSEATDNVNLAQVLQHKMPLRELVELMLPITGRDFARIQTRLHSGSLVRRTVRYRWEPLTITGEELAALLGQMHDRSAGTA